MHPLDSRVAEAPTSAARPARRLEGAGGQSISAAYRNETLADSGVHYQRHNYGVPCPSVAGNKSLDPARPGIPFHPR